MGRRAYYFDWLIFVPALLLSLLGLVTLLSIDSQSFYQQLVFAFLGLGLFYLFSRIDFSLYSYFDKYIYIFSLIFLLVTFLGPNVRGATRWLEIAGFRLQPSEIIKPFLLLSWSSLLVKYPPTKLKNILLQLGLILLPFLLVIRQPDLGNALIFASSWLGMIFLAGIPIILIAVGLLFVTTLLPLVYNLLHEYQKLRLQIFINPLLDPQGAGYNAIQSVIAVGSGLLFGRGFGRGTQSLLKFLPERHTDFIFASFAEEFGLLGGVVLLSIYFLLLGYLLVKLRKDTQISAEYLYGVGIFMLIFSHTVINIGMNMGLLPITGITLPFVSYGGSSLLSSWIGLGILTAALQNSGK